MDPLANLSRGYSRIPGLSPASRCFGLSTTRSTGELRIPIWSRLTRIPANRSGRSKTADYKKGVGHSHPPLIADGKVIVGFIGGEREVRGALAAYDAKSGALQWKTYTVPAPGEPGSESWAKSDMPPLGGPTWGTLSYDPQLGLVYAGVGQPAPWASTLRGNGDALYTNSVLALDIKTGKIRWHFQVVPSDNWDMDSPYESTLVDLPINGVTRKALIHTSKIGWGVVLDRVTGQFIQPFKTAYDNIITGWSASGRPVFNPNVIPTPEIVDSGKVFEVCPHFHGARNLQFSELQSDNAAVLPRYQQLVYGCHVRHAALRTRPGLPGDEPDKREVRARL